MEARKWNAKITVYIARSDVCFELVTLRHAEVGQVPLDTNVMT